MFNCCTLFNSEFLTRGLTLYRSLERKCPDFRLFVFAFDDFSAQYLRDLSLPSMQVVSLAEFEDVELLRIKPTRTRGEYCWTCASSTILYVLEKFHVPSCTYLDADVCFYDDPHLIEESMEGFSIGITPHRYAPGARRTSAEAHGIYCVQYLTIRNDDYGIRALKWWRERCIEWCYGRLEDGKFGDQKYLDDWPTRFQKVKIIEHHGAGLAPWNASQYQVSESPPSGYRVREKTTGNEFPLVFFHFHALRFYSKELINLVGGGYPLSPFIVDQLYRPYVEEQIAIAHEVLDVCPSVNPLGISNPIWWKYWGTMLYSRWNPSYACHYMQLGNLIKNGHSR